MHITSITTIIQLADTYPKRLIIGGTTIKLLYAGRPVECSHEALILVNLPNVPKRLKCVVRVRVLEALGNKVTLE